MCGIVGILGRAQAAPRLLEGLRLLEYRGYDSAGIATVDDGRIDRRRAEGKLANLEAVLEADALAGTSGIGHTRWATHGAPTVRNAHPHASEGVAIVHNGIIENFRDLRRSLEASGHAFETETDSEVIAHLIARYLKDGLDPRAALQATLQRLEGAFALAVLFENNDNLLFGARRGSPLVVGEGMGEMFLGSDAIALSAYTNRVLYLEEGDLVELTHDGARVFAATGEEVTRKTTEVSGVAGPVDKGNYDHFMQKEIHEQPAVVGQTLSSLIDPLAGTVQLPPLPFDLGTVPKITIIGCGTSFYAAMVAKYWFERMARIAVDIDIASEFRYRDAVLQEGGLAIFISQSGETADTLAALRYCKAAGQHTLSIVNVTESTMARESDSVLPIHAGPEIGVASTKAFTCQLAVLACLAIDCAVRRGTVSADQQAEWCQALQEVPSRMAEVLHHDERLREIATEVAKAQDVLYMGRGADFPIALEGALKLKEISYIHAEGYAAGELKHGPIALIDRHVPIIVIAPSGPLFDKTVSNMQEVIARDGWVLFLSDAAGIAAQGDAALYAIEMPSVHELVAPMLYAVPVQLLAYHVAVNKGTDVDQPRNLAKSVTVE